MTTASSSLAILLEPKNRSDTVNKALGAGRSISRLLATLVPSIRIHFRQMIADKLFISAEAAAGGYRVEHTNPEPPLALCYIGQDVHKDLPTNGRNT
jgi:hypothetical protein